MFFEIENTPENVKRKKPEKIQEDDPVLILKPFSSTPTVSFENVPVHVTSTKILRVENPKGEAVQVNLSKKPDKINLQFSWDENIIEPYESVSLIFSWCPQKPISQRFTLQISDTNKGRYDFFVICKSIAIKKPVQKSNNQVQTKKFGIRKSPLKPPKPKSPKNKELFTRNAMQYLKNGAIEHTNYCDSFVTSTVSKSSTQTLRSFENVRKESAKVPKTEPFKNNERYLNNMNNVGKLASPGSMKNMHNWIHNENFNIQDLSIDTSHALHSTEYFTGDSNFDIRRETYLIPNNKNVNMYDKENEAIIRQTPVKECKNLGSNRRNPNISVLSAIENMEFTPSKVYNKFVKKDNFETKKNITENYFVDNVKSSVNIEVMNEFAYYYEKSPLQTDEAVMNKTHPIIDLDFSGISKIEVNDIHNQQNANMIDFQYTVTNFDYKQMANDEDFQTIFNRNHVQMETPSSSFNPGRCSTEMKKNNEHILTVNASETFDVSSDDSHRRLSSETYTKSDSPIIAISSGGNEYKHSSPYTPETVPIVPDTASNIHCSRSLFVDNIKNYNERFNLKNSIREKNTNSTAKSIIEADLWLKSANESVGPNVLSAIPEENSMMSEMSICDTSKRIPSETFIMDRTYDLKNSKIATNDNVNVRRKWSKTTIKDTYNSAIFKVPKTRTESCTESKKMNIIVAEKSNHTTDVYALATVVDPFLASTYLYDEKAFSKLENEFKRWLNYLLTPPSDLDTELDVDIGKAWIENRNRMVPAAPTKEQVSSKYHTSHRLDSLRKIAKVLIKSSDISKVFLKVTSQIERKTLSIRTDKNLHLDIGLQKIILNLLMCYNPLWLRIGLEALYDKIIPLTSNDDINGLSNFIIDNMFRDPYVSSKHILIQPSYAANIKKFTLKKFLFLIYFLDQAKRRKIIFHDPCLFRRNAPFKQTKEILFQFTKEMLAGVGDITKHLRPTGYEVKHEQTYLNEYKYAVHNLAVDLRDGVRLTRLMEIILMEKDLTTHLRTPAISRLQKIHNAEIAFTALRYANFEIVGDITARDIVDGHREKTLSLLWQLIHKFRAPLFENASIKIQRWWRTKYLKIVLERRIERRKMQKFHNAAARIQSWWRGIQAKKIIAMKKNIETNASIIIQKNWRMWRQKNVYNNLKADATKIQRFYRRYLLMRDAKDQLIQLKKVKAAIKIQQWYHNIRNRKLFESQNYEREHFLKLKSSVIKMQNIFRAKLLMRNERKTFLIVKISTIKIQRFYRSVLKTRIVRRQYLVLKSAAIMIQNRFRANLEMKRCKNIYDEKRNAILKIQQYYKNYLIMKKCREDFLKIKSAAVYLQNYYRSKLLARNLQREYIKKKERAIIIQKYYRNYRQMKTTRDDFICRKAAVLFIQKRYKALLAMRKEKQQFLKLKLASIVLQRRFRAKITMEKQRKVYIDQKNAAIKIQQYYRSLLLTRKLRNEFLKKRQLIIFIQRTFRQNQAIKEERLRRLTLNAVVKIQRWYRSIICMREARASYLLIKKTTIILQRRYRSKIAMKIERQNYNKLKFACVILQRRYRAKKQMELLRQDYLRKKSAAITLQRRYRAFYMMKEERNNFVKLRNGTLVIQRLYRNRKLSMAVRRQYLTLKSATILIQHKFRANRAMELERGIFLMKKQSATILQRNIRAYLLMKKARSDFVQAKMAAIKIQKFYRSRIEMKKVQSDFVKVKRSAVNIQRFYRSYLKMKREKEKYYRLKEATLIIQRCYRNYVLARDQRNYYLELIERVRFVQRTYRGKKMMEREKQTFLDVKRSALIIQKYYRAYVLMRAERTFFIEKKMAALKIQRFYRSLIEMRSARDDYRRTRESALTIQKYYRSYLEMKRARSEYINLKRSALKIQHYYRNYKLARMQRCDYLKLLNTVQFLQRKYRANQDMKRCRRDYLALKKNTITIQSYYRSYLIMKRKRAEYLNLLRCVKNVQIRYRSKLLVRKFRGEMLNRISAVIKLQSYVRMWMCRRKYTSTVNSIIEIQRYYRRYTLMKYVRCEYLQTKRRIVLVQSVIRRWLIRRRYKAVQSAAISIQRAYREKMKRRHLRYNAAATKIQSYWKAYVVRRDYVELRRTVTFCQIRRRSTIQTRTERRRYVLLKKSAVKIQAATRGFLARKSLKVLSPRLKSLSLRKVVRAVTTIQAHWRGYKVRKLQDENSKVKLLRERWQNGGLQSNQLTLSERNDDALDVLGHFRDVASVIRAFKSLDLGTSVYPMMYTSDNTAGRIAEQLTLYMDTSNRSVSTLETLQLGVAILINLTKYEPTAHFIYSIDCVNMILNLLNRWCDKDSVLTRSLCTLLWLFGKYEENIKNLRMFFQNSKSYKAMCKIRSAILRKRKMEGRKRNSQNMNSSLRKSMTPMKSAMTLGNIRLPMVNPDFGVMKSTRPKIFQDDIFAINTVFLRYDLMFDNADESFKL